MRTTPLVLIALFLLIAPIATALVSNNDIKTVGFNNGRSRFTEATAYFPITGDAGITGTTLVSTYFARGSGGAWQPLSTDLTGDGAQEIIIGNGGCYDFKYNPPHPGFLCASAPSGISIVNGKTGVLLSEITLNLFDGYISGYVLDDIDLNGQNELLVLSNSTLFVFDWDESSNNHFDIVANVSMCGGNVHCLADTSEQFVYPLYAEKNFAEISCVNHGTSTGQVICYINSAHQRASSTGKFAIVNISRDGNWNMYGQFIGNSTSASMAVCDFDGDIYDDIVYYSNLFARVKAFEYDYTTNSFNVGASYGGLGEIPVLYGGIACESIDGDNFDELYIAPANGNHGAIYEGLIGGVRFSTTTSPYSVGGSKNAYGMFTSGLVGEYTSGICVGQDEDGYPKCYNGFGTIIALNYTFNTNDNMVFGKIANGRSGFFRTSDLSNQYTSTFTNGVIGYTIEMPPPDLRPVYYFNISTTVFNYDSYPQMILADFNGDNLADLLVSNSVSGSGASRIFYSSTVVPPTINITTTCDSPCVFWDNFSYIGSITSFGWLATTDGGRTLANGTHFYCVDDSPFIAQKNFRPLNIDSGKAIFKFKYGDEDKFSSFTIAIRRSSTLTNAAVVMLNGLENRVYPNFEFSDILLYNETTNASVNYEIHLDFSTKTFDLYSDVIGNMTRVVTGMEFMDTSIVSVDQLVIQTNAPYTPSCNWGFDYFKVETASATPGVTPPGGIGENQSETLIDGAVILHPEDGKNFFDETKCNQDEDANICFIRLVGGGLMSGLMDITFNNIPIILALAIVLALIGLAVKAFGG